MKDTTRNRLGAIEYPNRRHLQTWGKKLGKETGERNWGKKLGKGIEAALLSHLFRLIPFGTVIQFLPERIGQHT